MASSFHSPCRVAHIVLPEDFPAFSSDFLAHVLKIHNQRKYVQRQLARSKTYLDTLTIIMNEKIRCPKCKWEPAQEDKWLSLCGNLWNTFTTYGKCPECRKVYHQTQCHCCQQWSRHEDWYEGMEEWSVEEAVQSEVCMPQET